MALQPGVGGEECLFMGEGNEPTYVLEGTRGSNPGVHLNATEGAGRQE